MKIIILGAGPTGLGAARQLQSLGHTDWELWEADATPGGLAGSVIDEQGFTWDLGGHVQFSHYKTFDDAMDEALGADGWLHHERASWVRICESWVPYPFQYNLHRLPQELTLSCVKGLLAALRLSGGPGRTYANFEELIIGCFGEGIADCFMRPYNYKVWAYPPKELDTGWIGERVALPEMERIAESLITRKDQLSWGPNNTFKFPKSGGTGEAWRRLAAKLPQEKLKFGRRVTGIDAAAREVRAEDGTVGKYDRLISSLPLDIMAGWVGDTRHAQAASLLRYSSVHVLGIGLKGQAPEQLATKSWMYFPERNCPFYRVSVFSNYSPRNVPDSASQWSLLAEVSESPVKPVDIKRVNEQTIMGLLNTGMIQSREQISHVFHRRLERGYPTPALRRDEALEFLLPDLQCQGIYSRGRFGAWKYEVSNQDHSMMQGVEAVNHILNGNPELTLWFPHIVNATHPVLGKAWL